jgi:hypothetical protein
MDLFNCHFLGNKSTETQRNYKHRATVNRCHKLAKLYSKAAPLPSVNDMYKQNAMHNKNTYG